MTVDSSALTIYGNFFGSVRLRDTVIDAKIGGEALHIQYDKATGAVLNAGRPTRFETFDEQ